MNFREGDSVMHWTYGLGKVVRVEERISSGQKGLYYAVQINDMTIWVPADEMLGTRLRPPTVKSEFKKLLSALRGPSEPLPDDRLKRKTMLMEWLKDGQAASLCRVIHSLVSYRKIHPLNDSDTTLLKRAQSALIGEWGFALSITPAEAELELHRLLTSESAGV
jgi:RNA polymerase-interacting CarD/CdnL/TRCF family regulator